MHVSEENEGKESGKERKLQRRAVKQRRNGPKEEVVGDERNMGKRRESARAKREEKKSRERERGRESREGERGRERREGERGRERRGGREGAREGGRERGREREREERESVCE
jgi:hypothetical protein